MTKLAHYLWIFYSVMATNLKGILWNSENLHFIFPLCTQAYAWNLVSNTLFSKLLLFIPLFTMFFGITTLNIIWITQ